MRDVPARIVISSPLMYLRTLILLPLLALSACEAQQSSSDVTGDVARERRRDAAVVIGLRSKDEAVRAAAEAITQGTPWLGTMRVAPALAVAARRTPEALLVAARAAAGWEGWSEVERLLRGQSWLGELAEGEGHELLARAALARSADTVGLAHASAALRATSAREERGQRLVLLARAHDRMNHLDSAAAAYRGAAEQLPDVSDWLRLRAAGVVANEADRRALYAALRNPVARERVRITEALALERTGQPDDAARAYAAAGDRVASLRLRLAATDSGASRAARGELISLVRDRAGASEGRRAIQLLDEAGGTLSSAEQLLVARAAMRGGDATRAVRGFARGGTLTQRDHYDYGLALGRLDRWRESRERLARVTDRALAGDAAYHRARARYHMGDAAASRRELAEVARRYAADADAATLALTLLADLQGDDGRDTDSRATLLDLVRRYPAHSRAPGARFRAAIIAQASGNHARAASEMDALVARHPRAGDATAATYWAGRAHLAAGNAAVARARWNAIIERDPLSYYALLARRRLRAESWKPEGNAPGAASVEDIDQAGERVRALDALELDAEARLEVDAMIDNASRADSGSGVEARRNERLRATARMLRELGRTTQSIALGWKLVERDVRDAGVYRLVFPVVRQERLATESRDRKLDPALVAALIRQESSFNPRARSPVGARGLMQIMPEVGRSLARAHRFPLWDPAILYDPDASLTLGTAHLAAFLKQYDDLTRALAAYNAGPSRVRRWSGKSGMSDPEMFAERIPFTETRDYVRIVQRNAEVYRELYEW